MSRRAKEAAMDSLHAALAKELATAIEPHTVEDENGNERTVRASASMLNVARQFLKDNGVDSTAVDNNPLANLAKKATQFVDDDANGDEAPFH